MNEFLEEEDEGKDFSISPEKIPMKKNNKKKNYKK